MTFIAVDCLQLFICHVYRRIVYNRSILRCISVLLSVSKYCSYHVHDEFIIGRLFDNNKSISRWRCIYSRLHSTINHTVRT